MINVMKTETTYYETKKLLDNHWKKYEKEGITEEEIDALDEQADEWHETISKIISQVREEVSPILKPYYALMDDDLIKQMFIFKEEKTMATSFKLLKLY